VIPDSVSHTKSGLIGHGRFWSSPTSVGSTTAAPAVERMVSHGLSLAEADQPTKTCYQLVVAQACGIVTAGGCRAYKHVFNTMIDQHGSNNPTLYGVLNFQRNFLYLVDQDRSVVTDLVQHFGQRHGMIAVDVDACVQNMQNSIWMAKKIDNTVCNNWGISVYDTTLRPWSLQRNLMYLVPRTQALTSEDFQVCNNLQIACKFVTLAKYFCQQLSQYQPLDVLEWFADDAWVHQANLLERQAHEQRQTLLNQVIEQIYNTVYLGDLTDPDYQENTTSAVNSLTKQFSNIARKGRDL
jgi:hypothetical protein